VERDREIVMGTVNRNTKIAEGVYEIVIETEVCKTFIPGQFVNIYLSDKSMLLPRPISISDAESGFITLIFKIAGKGTEYLSAYPENHLIKLSGPLGNGFSFENDYKNKQVALVAGGIGIPPMVGLAKRLKEQNAVLNIFLGFQSGVFLLEKFREFTQNVFVATNDGNLGFHGNVVDLLIQGKVYDEYFACGPKAMLKSLSEYTSKIERNVHVSIEKRMGCGYGACLGCTCKIREGGDIVRKSVCKQGPVFLGKEVVWD